MAPNEKKKRKSKLIIQNTQDYKIIKQYGSHKIKKNETAND